METMENMPWRSTTLTNNRRNSQGIYGKNGVKRVKMTNKHEVCKFNFSLLWDEFDFTCP